MKQQSQIVTTAPAITFALAVKISSYRVDRPMTDRLPVTEHLFVFSSYVLHFE
jgi:hypothetical protein